MTGLALARRIGNSRPLAQLRHSTLGVHVAVILLRAAPVRERVRFTARELIGRRRIAIYRIAGSQARFAIEHATPDIYTYDELLVRGEYEPPAEVQAALRALGRAPRVLDLGVNIGIFSAFALARFGAASVRGLEPDPRNARLAALTLAANGARAQGLDVACAGAAAGVVDFEPGGYGASGIADGGPITAVVRDAFELLDGVDLLKIDIEGGEWEILDDPRFERIPVPVIVLEFHARLCPHADPPGAALAALAGAGYDTVVTDHWDPVSGTVWGVKRS